MTVPAPWSLPTDLMARILRDLKTQAALNVAAHSFTASHCGTADLSHATRRQWVVQQRVIPESRPVYGRHQH